MSKVLSLTHSCAAITELVQQDNVTVSEPLQHLVAISELLCDISELLCDISELLCDISELLRDISGLR